MEIQFYSVLIYLIINGFTQINLRKCVTRYMEKSISFPFTQLLFKDWNMNLPPESLVTAFGDFIFSSIEIVQHPAAVYSPARLC